jgi:hypothetical protein
MLGSPARWRVIGIEPLLDIFTERMNQTVALDALDASLAALGSRQS